MPGFLSTLLDWGTTAAAWVFTAWGLSIIAVVCVIAFLSGTRSWFGQMIDWKWNPAKLKAHNAKLPPHRQVTVKWRRARAQQYIAPRLAIPMGMILLATMLYHLFFSFTLATYVVGIIAWFVCTPVRYAWMMYVSVALNKQRYVDSQRDREAFGTAEPVEYTARQILMHRFKWSFRTPASEKRQVVIAHTRMLWLNSVASFFVNFVKLGWLWNINLAFMLIAHALAAIIWPISAVCSMFYLASEANEVRPRERYSRDDDKYDTAPWWVSDRVSAPKWPAKKIVSNNSTSATTLVKN